MSWDSSWDIGNEKSAELLRPQGNPAAFFWLLNCECRDAPRSFCGYPALSIDRCRAFILRNDSDSFDFTFPEVMNSVVGHIRK